MAQLGHRNTFTHPAVGQQILAPHLLSAAVTQNHDAVWKGLDDSLSSYSVALQLPATQRGQCHYPWAVLHHTSQVARRIRAEEKQQVPQWKTWLNVLDCPAVSAVAFRGNYTLQTLCLHSWRCVCVHATFQVCLACCLAQASHTWDSPCRFGLKGCGKSWEVYHKVSSESGGLLVLCWGACCSTGKLCCCAFVRLIDVKATLAQRVLSARARFRPSCRHECKYQVQSWKSKETQQVAYWKCAHLGWKAK